MKAKMTDIEFLEWTRSRLVSIYEEKENTDFMLRFLDVIKSQDKIIRSYDLDKACQEINEGYRKGILGYSIVSSADSIYVEDSDFKNVFHCNLHSMSVDQARRDIIDFIQRQVEIDSIKKGS